MRIEDYLENVPRTKTDRPVPTRDHTYQEIDLADERHYVNMGPLYQHVMIIGWDSMPTDEVDTSVSILKNWCEQNLKGRYEVTKQALMLIELADDAMLVKLAWDID